MRPSLAEKWSMRRRSASDGMDGIGMSAIANYRDIDLGCPQRAATTRKRARPRRIHQIINCPASDLMKSADRLDRTLGKTPGRGPSHGPGSSSTDRVLWGFPCNYRDLWHIAPTLACHVRSVAA